LATRSLEKFPNLRIGIFRHLKVVEILLTKNAKFFSEHNTKKLRTKNSL